MQDLPLAQRAARNRAFVAKSVPPLALLAAVIIVRLGRLGSGLPVSSFSPGDVAPAGDRALCPRYPLSRPASDLFFDRPGGHRRRHRPVVVLRCAVYLLLSLPDDQILRRPL
jgi:hypothetical protein